MFDKLPVPQDRTRNPSSGRMAMNCLDPRPQNRYNRRHFSMTPLRQFSMTPLAKKGASPTMPGSFGRRARSVVLAWALPLLFGFVFLGAAATSAQAQVGSITGKITDESGDPVPFANVFIKGTQLGGTANAEGKF